MAPGDELCFAAISTCMVLLFFLPFLLWSGPAPLTPTLHDNVSLCVAVIAELQSDHRVAMAALQTELDAALKHCAPNAAAPRPGTEDTSSVTYTHQRQGPIVVVDDDDDFESLRAETVRRHHA